MGTDIKKYLTRFLPKKKEEPKRPPIPSKAPLVVEHPVISAQPKSAEENHSRRTEDMSAESALAHFLDENFYSHFPNADAFDSIERVCSKNQQLSGIDVVFNTKDGRTFLIDEKAQLYYLNKDLPTFAFEVEFLRHGIPTTGWLCNKDLETDLYLLIWPFATKDSPKAIKSDDFTKAIACWFPKLPSYIFLSHTALR